jgi:hypothetical protein
MPGEDYVILIDTDAQRISFKIAHTQCPTLSGDFRLLTQVPLDETPTGILLAFLTAKQVVEAFWSTKSNSKGL